MGLVCRPILMYNEYVPAIAGRRTWQYQVLGYHDGMDIGKPIYIDRTKSFQQLYDIYVQEDQAIDYSLQIHYGLHGDDGGEELFWEKETIFTFISFIQFKEKKITEYNNCLEKKEIHRESNISVRAYYALDYNDSILVLKCDRYDEGMRFINNLYENIGNSYPFEITNSYSILAFKANEMQELRCGQKEIIDRVELRVVESYPGSITLLYDKLKDRFSSNGDIRLNRYTLLGMDDAVILIENIPCNLFLNLYTDELGILCNSKEETQRYAAAITTKLMYKKEDEEKNGAAAEGSLAGNTEFCSAFSRYIKYYYRGRKSLLERTEEKTLLRIANALGKIEYVRKKSGTIMEYNFFTLFFPFYIFVQLHMKAADQSKEYYDFLTYFNICTQNYDRPDRIFLHNTDFNIRYFEMQTKYFTLYSAYIYRLKRVLNKNGKNKYEFILCTGMSAMTEVAEFHEMEDDEYRLFKVEIAETSMYNIKDMLCILGHEVAHFVGTDTRSRDNRYEHTLRMISRTLVMEFQCCFEAYGFNIHVDSRNIWKEYEGKFVEWIRQYIDRDYNIQYLREKMDLGEETDEIIKEFIQQKQNKYRLYTKNMKKDFEKAIEDMLELQGTEIFEDAIWMFLDEKIRNHEIEYEDKDKYIKEYQSFLKDIITNCFGEKKNVTHGFVISKALDIELYLLRECYADLISILVLNLNLEEYLETIVSLTENDGHSVEDLHGTKIMARVALVMVVMHYNDDRSAEYHRWGNEELECSTHNDVVRELKEDAVKFMWMYIKNEVPTNPDDIIHDCGMIIYDQTILMEAVAYLLHCREAFYKNIDAEQLCIIKEFNELTKCVDADEFYKIVMKLITEYEADIYDDLDKTANEINEKIPKKYSYGACGDGKSRNK